MPQPNAKANSEIGAFEAKTKLSELLRKVQQGERFTITVRGRAVADLVPADNPRKRVSDEILNRLRNPPIRGVSDEAVLDWIREGRK